MREMSWPAYGLFYLFPLATLLGTLWGGPWAFLSPALAGVLVPVLDLVLGQDERNPTDDECERLAGQTRWRRLLYPFVALQLALLVGACWWAAHQPLTGAEWAALVMAVGVVNGGLSINVAHELCHRHSRLEQGLAQVLWFTVGYMHFHIEHRLGHHARVATPADPATARLGESVYAFYARSIVGGYRSAWHLETNRLRQLGLPLVSARNQMLWYAALPVAFTLALYLAWGVAAAGFFVVQAAAAVLVLETVNYLEHYGLERQLVAPGQFERVGIEHSWNSSRRLTNYLLLKLQRHSDHHVNPGRRYQTLRAFAEGPELPLGYGGMVPLALIPPIWHRIMDPRVRAFQERVVTVTIPGVDGAACASTHEQEEPVRH